MREQEEDTRLKNTRDRQEDQTSQPLPPSSWLKTDSMTTPTHRTASFQCSGTCYPLRVLWGASAGLGHRDFMYEECE